MKKFNHLNIPDGWKQYWSRYPQGYTIIEALINWVSQVDDMVDNQNKLTDNVKQFRNELDTFIDQFDTSLQDTVTDTLSDWQSSGFLDIVIDQALDTKYHEMDDRLSSQLAHKTNKGEIGLSDLDKNKTQFDGTWFSDDFIQDLSNAEIKTTFLEDESISTAKYMDHSITKKKLNIPDDNLLPKTYNFDRGNMGTEGVTELDRLKRAHSELIYGNKNDVIKSNSDIVFSVWERLGESEYQNLGSWTTEFTLDKNMSFRLSAKYDDDRNLSTLIYDLENKIYHINGDTALKSEEITKLLPTNLNFQQGFFGADGTNQSTGTRVRTDGYIDVEKNSLVKIKNVSDTQFVLLYEGDDNYITGLWRTEPVIADGRRMRIAQRFNDNRHVGGSIELFNDNLEIVKPNHLIKGSDVKYYIPDDEVDYGKYINYGLVWGHEYLYSWYDRLRKNQSVKMTWAGDSTTLNSGLEVGFTRSELGKKILTLGGYDETLITSINAGHGTQHTGNWLGGEYDEDKRTPNGFLDEDMQESPDLYIFSYGFNDGSNSHFPELSWQERIDRFEAHLNIGLERIRGTQYNKSPDEMAIILTTPIAAYDDGRGNTPDVWNDKIRPIIQKACREYKCAFVDITARQYDHDFSGSWSTNDDFVHPNETANVDYMSMFDGLIFPRLLHK